MRILGFCITLVVAAFVTNAQDLPHRTPFLPVYSAMGSDQSPEPLFLGSPTQCRNMPRRDNFTITDFPDECEYPIPHTCRYYIDCAEASLSCGPHGYPIGYGFHYCSLFARDLRDFSPRGRAWVLRTMTCLQHALVPIVPALAEKVNCHPGPECGHDSDRACAELKELAFDTHPKCYVDSGVCNLRSVRDYILIAKVVGVGNFLTKQAVQTAFACPKQWLGK
ncbi:hypothetical protein EXIGLDRAFT_723446 [Exidia glandulosa HHB12029]|uniref:Uncharacterized protein n=1 Tax=Exidia glandulosa HHB12029 TaxID=1314781 RepID=A0A165EU49_EXIGL|nr:hypothetical protein EXIGLDRAFT_723446 [Exidia glandulosa HHB12029]